MNNIFVFKEIDICK